MLVIEVQRLRKRLAKNSHNSSKSPSSDGPVRKTKRLRKKSGRKQGRPGLAALEAVFAGHSLSLQPPT
jgi:transposase